MYGIPGVTNNIWDLIVSTYAVTVTIRKRMHSYQQHCSYPASGIGYHQHLKYSGHVWRMK
ncbi:MAG: hypothetical protein IPP29_21175 [Bacteroidetes bacterium]|nr:hypothetical protein [Bacteroidota bacterium]